MEFSRPEKNIAQLALQPGTIVADLGAGPGAYTFAAAGQLDGTGRVYAVEVQRGLLPKIKAEARRRGFSNIEVLWGDIERTGGTQLADQSVDVVLVCNTLFLLEDKKGFIQEVQRILKPNGRVLVVDWTDSHQGLGPHPMMLVTESAARQLFEGFSFERSIDAGAHHFGFIIKKV